MNRERAKELLPIFEAYSKGKTVQYRPLGGREWNDDMGDVGFQEKLFEYRIKPEPHDIKWAAEQMQAGLSVRRSYWRNSECRIDYNCNTLYGGGSVGDGMRILPADILADDWEIYEPESK